MLIFQMIEQAELNRACFARYGEPSQAKLFGRHGEPRRTFFPKPRAKTERSRASAWTQHLVTVTSCNQNIEKNFSI